MGSGGRVAVTLHKDLILELSRDLLDLLTCETSIGHVNLLTVVSGHRKNRTSLFVVSLISE